MGVYYKDKNEFKLKFSKIKDGGYSNLHIVSDFDRTLTYGLKDGVRTGTVYAKVRASELMSDDYKKEGNSLFDIYHPLEISTELSFDEKKRFMTEWWEKHYALMIKHKFNLNYIPTVLRDNTVMFRDGANEFFKIIKENKIPILILSAGIGDGVKWILEDKGDLDENVIIVSNFLEFDKEGFAIKFKRPLIHTFNKNEAELPNDYHKIVEERKNVILIGDSSGDTNMADGVKLDTIIKIGFLNEKANELMHEFLKLFDVVITGDSDFSFINELIEEIK